MMDLNNQDNIQEISENMAREKKEKRPSKLKSAKLWVTIWAVVMVSFIVFANRTDFVIIAQWLCGVPLAYIGANVWQKSIYSKKDEKEE